jgi:hypothetical protein
MSTCRRPCFPFVTIRNVFIEVMLVYNLRSFGTVNCSNMLVRLSIFGFTSGVIGDLCTHRLCLDISPCSSLYTINYHYCTLSIISLETTNH